MEPAEPAATHNPGAGRDRAWQRHPVLAEIAKALAMAAVILAAGFGIFQAVAALTAVGYPSCSWPLRVRGRPSAAQPALVRCYLQDLAHNDQGAMMAVADDDPPVRLTPADFAHAADARAGLATATFSPNPSDTESATVTITFADGAHTTVYLTNLIARGGPSVWRLNIGTAANSGSGHPATSTAPPSVNLGPPTLP